MFGCFFFVVVVLLIYNLPQSQVGPLGFFLTLKTIYLYWVSMIISIISCRKVVLLVKFYSTGEEMCGALLMLISTGNQQYSKRSAGFLSLRCTPLKLRAEKRMHTHFLSLFHISEIITQYVPASAAASCVITVRWGCSLQATLFSIPFHWLSPLMFISDPEFEFANGSSVSENQPNTLTGSDIWLPTSVTQKIFGFFCWTEKKVTSISDVPLS